MMLRNSNPVRRCRSHHHFNGPFSQIIRMPFRANSNNCIIQFSRNTTAHRHDHRLTLKYGLALFKMGHNIFCYNINPAGTTNQRFKLCPLCFRLLHIIHIIRSQLFVQLFHQTATRFTQFHLSQTTFVVNPYGCTILNSLGNIVHINIMPEYSRRIHICRLNRSSRKSQIGSIRQSIPQILCKTIFYF